MKRILPSILIAVAAIFCVGFVPTQNAKAVDWFPIVPCGLNQQPANATRTDTLSNGKVVPHDYTQPCNQCLLIELGKNMIDFAFFGIVPMVGTLFFLWAGFLILWGGRNGASGAIGQGTKIMTNTAIGIAIILSSWLITNFILKNLANDDRSDNWYKIECRVGSLKDLADATVPKVGGTGTQPGQPSQPGQPIPPTGPGAVCPGSDQNLCVGKVMTCSNSSCSQYAGLAAKYAGGAASANLLKAIMMKESSCNAEAASPAGAYGLMQMLPATANIYKSRCDIRAEIDAGWLKRNPEGSVCIAAEYIKALAAGNCGSNVQNIAAGYNGGGGACSPSVSCGGGQTCGESTRKWQCFYDDSAKKTCNTGYNETRDYATKVLYCATNPGF